MTESLTDFAAALSGSDITVLEEIIDSKYLKFKKFFKLMKDYKNDINKLDYEFGDSDTLAIEVTLKKKISLESKKELIAKWKDAGYDVDAKIKEKKIKVTIKYKEKKKS